METRELEVPVTLALRFVHVLAKKLCDLSERVRS